jgi:hypothetical protein
MVSDERLLLIDEQDPLADWLAISTRAAKTGSIKFDIDGRSTARIDIIDNKNTITIGRRILRIWNVKLKARLT